ncbi:MAG: hypothetical protein GM46_10730 [actinobacterium acAcidi]|nr:MAG: hypothetical protein GM46_10730 [actinobacterium acAcidi]
MSNNESNNQSTGAFGQQQVNDLFALLSDFNPVTSGAKAVDQAKRTVESLILLRASIACLMTLRVRCAKSCHT